MGKTFVDSEKYLMSISCAPVLKSREAGVCVWKSNGLGKGSNVWEQIIVDSEKEVFLFVYVMYCLCVSYDDLFVIRIECVVIINVSWTGE